MPFVNISDRPLGQVIPSDVGVKIEQVAMLGYFHKDLRWRHVGRIGEKVIFIDLTDVQEGKSPSSAIERMRRKLESEPFAGPKEEL